MFCEAFLIWPVPAFANHMNELRKVQLLIILHFSAFSLLCKCQDFQFTPSGKMDASNFFIDTVLQTDYKKYLNKTEFCKVDSAKLNDLRAAYSLKEIIAKRCLNNDTTEYYYIYNSTYKDIKLNRLNNKLVAVEIAKDLYGRFRPVNFFIYPKCGTGVDYSDLVLKTGQILLIKTKKQSPGTHFQTIARLKIKTSTNGTITSDEFPIQIDVDSFSLNLENKKYFFSNKQQITVLE